jgi:hypothetical protein
MVCSHLPTTSYFISASVYNTLWAGLQNRNRDSATHKHYKVLWLTTLIRQYMQLDMIHQQQIFLNEVRAKNAGTKPQALVPVIALASPPATGSPSGNTRGASGNNSPAQGPSGGNSPTAGPSRRSPGPYVLRDAPKRKKK